MAPRTRTKVFNLTVLLAAPLYFLGTFPSLLAALLPANAFAAAGSVPPTAVTGLSVRPSTDTLGAVATYTISFNTSSTGVLASGLETITVTFPTGNGITLPAIGTPGNVSVNGTDVTAVIADPTSGAYTITTPVAVAASSFDANGRPLTNGTATVVFK